LASAKDIPPGGEGKIKVTYKTGKKIGKKTQGISVYTNDPEKKVVQLKLTVDIQAVLAVEPDRIYFGVLRKGQKSEEKSVVLQGTAKDVTRILSATAENVFIRAEAVPTEVKEGENKGQIIKVSVLPGMKLGRFNERITVQTDHKEVKSLFFYVGGMVVGDITAFPPNVSFGMFRKGGRYDKIVRVIGAPGVTFHVVEAKSSSPGLVPTVAAIKEGAEYRISVTLMDTFEKDILREKILIMTDLKDQEPIEIGVFGQAFSERPIANQPAQVINGQ
jgi:hypothetical protein